MTNFVRNPTEAVGVAADSATRQATQARTVNETPLADNPNAVVVSKPVYLVEESI